MSLVIFLTYKIGILNVKRCKINKFKAVDVEEYMHDTLRELTEEDIKNTIELLFNCKLLKEDGEGNGVSHERIIGAIKKILKVFEKKNTEGNTKSTNLIAKFIKEELEKTNKTDKSKKYSSLRKTLTVAALPLTFTIGTIFGGFCLAGISLKSIFKK